MRKAYIMQECHRCGHHFVLEYRSNGSYGYTTEPCECGEGFSPVDGMPSISQWLESLKENEEPEEGANVVVSWRDKLGVIYVEIDGYGVSFCDGYAIFSDLDEKQYKVPLGDLIEVAFK